MQVERRFHNETDGYRYGFNGMEKDNELKGEGNSYDFGARMYDPRIARWFARDPLEAKYPNMSPYNSFNNNPIYYIDPDGRDAIVSITGTGTKNDPFVVKITANYYYEKATEQQKKVMNSVSSDLASVKKFTKGEKKEQVYYEVSIDVNFVESKDPVASAKKDLGVNGSPYGNVFNLGNGGNGEEMGHASFDEIVVWENEVQATTNSFMMENQKKAYEVIFYNVLIEEVLHNLGGLHQDGGAVPKITEYRVGSTISQPEKPPGKNNYTSNNAEAIFDRIDKPLGTDAKPDPVDKKGNIITPPLRDTGGSAGRVVTDEVKKQ